MSESMQVSFVASKCLKSLWCAAAAAAIDIPRKMKENSNGKRKTTKRRKNRERKAKKMMEMGENGLPIVVHNIWSQSYFEMECKFCVLAI